MRPKLTSSTKSLLYCGVVAGPIFAGVVLIQAYVREGFVLVRIPLSMLAVGDLGWIQTANFLVNGALVMASAVGVARVIQSGRGRRAAAPLIALYGMGLVTAGLFVSDPIEGFPPGAHGSSDVSWHAQLHGMSFAVAQIAVVLCCILLSIRFAGRKQKAWAIYSLVTAIVSPGLVIIGFVTPAAMGAAFFGTALVTLGWLGLTLVHLMRAEPGTR